MILVAKILFEKRLPLWFWVPKECPKKRELTFLSTNKYDIRFGSELLGSEEFG